MKLNRFSEFILIESVKNPVLMKSIVKELLYDIKKITPTIKRTNMDFNNYSKMWWELEIRWLDLKVKSRLEKLFKSKQENLLKTGIIMAYQISEHPLLKWVDDLEFEPSGETEIWIHVFFKDLYSKRYKPPKYIYHTSATKNRDSIEKNGLKPTEFSKGNWTLEGFQRYYPPAVFAALKEDGWHKGGDIWRIDTTYLENKWWVDLNFYRHDDKYKKPVEFIMTFESIPSQHLKLLKP